MILILLVPHRIDIYPQNGQNETLDINPSPTGGSSISADPGLIEAIVIAKAEEHGVNTELAVSLAKYESNLDPLAENPNSSATGVFQFIDGTWEGYCEGDVRDAEANIECAMEILSEERGILHWTADPNTRKHLLDNGFVDPSLLTF